MIAVSYGGGVNSTALLWGMHERGLEPAVVLFADTGGELPETYNHVREVEAWCSGRGWLFQWVSNVDPTGRRHQHQSLERECWNNQTLPSLAFGNKGCSAKWKRQPMDRWLRGWPEAVAHWGRGGKVQRWLGIDADESHRSANLTEDARFTYHRPLIDWGWGRDECVAAIERSPFDVPGKSACWFCPATKKHEVLRLRRSHPHLFERAVAMELQAQPNLGPTVKGLGRAWSWKTLADADDAQLKLFPETQDEACGCYDGEAAEDAS